MDLSSFGTTNWLNNPLFVGALIPLIVNVIGYLYNCAEAGKILPYSKGDAAVTLGLFETVFIVIMGIGGLSADLTAIVGFILLAVRSFRQQVVQATTNAANTEALQPVLINTTTNMTLNPYKAFTISVVNGWLSITVPTNYQPRFGKTQNFNVIGYSVNFDFNKLAQTIIDGWLSQPPQAITSSSPVPPT